MSDLASNTQRWVIKIGSALLTRDGRGLHCEAIKSWVAQMAAIRERGTQIVLVSSGSIAEGMHRLGWSSRPEALYQLQAAAAVGQMGLAQIYEASFRYHAINTAQILLTHDDVSDRGRYLNARSTLRQLLTLGVVPVVNENDTVSTEAIMLGDNDTLAGLVCNLVQAHRFIILTDQQGLYSTDPRYDGRAQLITDGKAGDPNLAKLAGGGGNLGKGGMRTKLTAAELAARSATETTIASGLEADVLVRLADGEALGTRLIPTQAPVAARKQWLAGQVQIKGRLRLDDGAVSVLRAAGRSLLPVGVREVTGEFKRGELVVCESLQGLEIARGLVNYNAAETNKIKGQSSDKIIELLGYVDEPELIHRDNLLVTSNLSG